MSRCALVACVLGQVIDFISQTGMVLSATHQSDTECQATGSMTLSGDTGCQATGSMTRSGCHWSKRNRTIGHNEIDVMLILDTCLQ